ncbi:MAG: hypothetical protein ACRDSZ_11180 [Pseudonocardiaceae bacterium]
MADSVAPGSAIVVDVSPDPTAPTPAPIGALGVPDIARAFLFVPPETAVVFEDTPAGVAAGHTGHFGYGVAVNRVEQADALRAHGADIVGGDLAELLDRS